MILYNAVFAVDGDAWEVAHMLISASQPVEKCRLAAVLLACESERQDSTFRNRIFVSLVVIDAFLAESRVGVMVG